MSDEALDLSGEQEPKPADEQGKKKRDRRGEEEPGARTRRRHEAELRGRLDAVLERIVEQLEGRGDHELADAIREDSRAMIGGMIGVTRPVAALRPLILTGLGVVEPVLAFGRVARILLTRAADRRAQRSNGDEPPRYASWAEVPDDELAIAAGDGDPEALAEFRRRESSP